MQCIRTLLAASLICIALPYPALAARGNSICDRAAERASVATGVPEQILRAIARAESGRTSDGVFAPWPWTVNQGGDGRFFDGRDAAVAHAQTALDAGETNIDIGCFQVNIRWHGAAFPSLDMMFDPDRNALYAAEFLLRLSDELGSWEAAIGAYHSRHADAAAGYLAKVAAHIASQPSAEDPPRITAMQRENSYPLLQGGRGSLGSLVAIESGPAPSSLLR